MRRRDPPYQRFCGNCGHRLEKTFLMPGREVRKTVTVVFCDPASPLQGGIGRKAPPSELEFSGN